MKKSVTDKALLTAVKRYKKYRLVAEKLNIAYQTVKNRMSIIKRRQRGITDEQVSIMLKMIRSSLRKPSTFVITAAQNATPVNQRFYQALLHYCKVNQATLLVIPFNYKNATSQWTEAQQANNYWVDEINPFLVNRPVQLNKNIVIMSDISIQPTATKPLSGLDTITGNKSGIFGHPKLQLTTVPTPQQSLPKILTTTGCVTLKNYTNSKAGKKGEFHHTYGAAIVEIDGDKFHLRQINALNDGSFIDLDRNYSAQGVTQADRPLGLVMGDIHADFIDPLIEHVTFHDPDGIINTLKPQALCWHDLYDGYSGSHHHEQSFFTRFVKHHYQRHNVSEEIDRTLELIERCSKSWAMNYIVGSNHNDHLMKWLERCDPKKDLENAHFYFNTMARMTKVSTMGLHGAEVPNALEIIMKERIKNSGNIRFLGRDESLLLGDVEICYHGDIGPNGSRGHRNAMDKVGSKMVIGHSHSPGIEGGVYQTGTSSRLKLEYNSGPSSWLHTHYIIYANGKRSLINIIDGQWRNQTRG